jgi:tight adherence protein B
VGPVSLASGVALVVAVLCLVDAVVSVRRRAAVVTRFRPGGGLVRRTVGLGAVQWAAPVVAYVVLGPTTALVVAVLAAAALPWARARLATRASASATDDALPDVVDALARAMRAGAPPVVALRAAAAASPPALAAGLATVASASQRGVPLVVATDRWAAGAGVDGAELVATAMAVTSWSGGDPARSLTGVADTLRDRRALRREVRALSSQARLSALVIAAAPVAFAVVAAGTDGATGDFLLRTPLGLGCLVAGLVLDLAGWWWMDRITGGRR